MNHFRRAATASLAVAALMAGMAAVEAYAGDPRPVPAAATATSARPPWRDHVLVVVMENNRYDAVVGHPSAPWVSSLARDSADMRNFYAESHPSQPNYLALFSGSMHGVTDNRCRHDLGDRPNLARQLLDAGRSFAGYSEGLPSVGWGGCSHRGYVRRHNPWVNFSNVPASVNRPYRMFPRAYDTLPTVSFVVPNLCHDMHDCSRVSADKWLSRNFTRYIAWAKTHNSLFILTFDEDDRTGHNHIPTIIAGAGVRPGRYGAHLDHYDLLHTLQRMYRLPLTGAAAHRSGLPDIWMSA